MKLKELCNDERPRERLLKNGVESLSNVELLAILLHSGTKSMNVIDLARELLKTGGGSLGGVAGMSVEKLQGLSGIGRGKSSAIAAAFELGRRCSEEKFMESKKAMSSPKAVYRLMSPFLRRLEHEECWVLYLNRRNLLIGKERMTIGSDNCTVMDSKAILRRALEKKACGIILVHNHPSGNALPSIADIGQTQELKRALHSCDISLLDHVVIGGDGYYSFADEELVDATTKGRH